MGVDASIALGVRPAQIENPMNALAQVMQLKGAQQSNALNALQMEKYQREVSDENQLRDLTRQAGGDLNKLRELAYGAGNYKQGMVLDKTLAERKRADFEMQNQGLDMAKKRLDMTGQAFGALRSNPTPENASATLDYLGQQGILQPEQVQQFRQQIIANPGGIAAFADQVFRWSLTAKDQLPQTQTNNIGGSTVTQAIDPVTGKPTMTGSIQNTQTPDGQAGRQIQLAQLAETKRHHGVTEGNQASTLSKPFEVTGPDGVPILVRQDKQGNISRVEGFSPKGAAGGKPLSGAALKQLTEARDTAVTLDGLLGSFKDGFASKGVLGFGADASLAAKSVLGSDKDAVEWWKNYRKQSELVERHALFGAALTPTEQESWRNADIGPGVNKDVIKRNLQTRADLTKRMLETTRQDLIDAGQSEQRVNAIAGRGPKEAPQAPVKLNAASADTEYAKLPSGAEFIAPDGSRRRKP